VAHDVSFPVQVACKTSDNHINRIVRNFARCVLLSDSKSDAIFLVCFILTAIMINHILYIIIIINLLLCKKFPILYYSTRIYKTLLMKILELKNLLHRSYVYIIYHICIYHMYIVNFEMIKYYCIS